jgi:hypothetical protein
MIITPEWLESIQDERGLTRGQVQLLGIWKDRLAFVGYDHLPDVVANFLMMCKGYRGPKPEDLVTLSNQHANHHLRQSIPT